MIILILKEELRVKCQRRSLEKEEVGIDPFLPLDGYFLHFARDFLRKNPKTPLEKFMAAPLYITPPNL